MWPTNRNPAPNREDDDLEPVPQRMTFLDRSDWMWLRRYLTVEDVPDDRIADGGLDDCET